MAVHCNDYLPYSNTETSLLGALNYSRYYYANEVKHSHGRVSLALLVRHTAPF